MNEIEVDHRIEQRMKVLESRSAPYWTIINDFQLNYNGKLWKIVGSYDTGGYGVYENCQLCGHVGCRFIFTIQDPLTGDELNIGDECVINYCADTRANKTLHHFRSNITNRISCLKRNRDLLVKIETWITENSDKRFSDRALARRWWNLRRIADQLYTGKALSGEQKVQIEAVFNPDSVPIQEYQKMLDKFTPATSWEKSFVETVKYNIQTKTPLSQKQLEVLQKMGGIINDRTS